MILTVIYLQSETTVCTIWNVELRNLGQETRPLQVCKFSLFSLPATPYRSWWQRRSKSSEPWTSSQLRGCWYLEIYLVHSCAVTKFITP